MRKTLFALAIGLAALPMMAAAQQSPIGKWTTLDDETGKPMTVVEVYEAQNGTLAAKIIENIAAPPTCTKCSGADKGRSIIGMPVLWNLKPTGKAWGDGNGLKPSSGDTFRAKSVEVIEGGAKLRITGCKGPFCRKATWVRN
ncbi:DUF2147 domain-containing protein [Luteimonas sp. e5]